MSVGTICTIIGTSISIIGIVVGYFKTTAKKIKAIQLGIQAMLRAQLISMWEEYSRKGYAPIYVRDNFENVYKNYHALGANGVMDDVHKKFLKLPTDKQSE